MRRRKSSAEQERAGQQECALELVRPPQMIPRGGRKAVGWMGGARLMDAVERAPEGMAVRMALPQRVPYDRIRWGIYAAARLRQMNVRVVRQNGCVHVWRLGGMAVRR